VAGRQKKRPTENYFDYSLLFIVLFLLGFGLVMIYSTSSYEATLQGHESTFYLKKQVMATVIGLAAMIVVVRVFVMPGSVLLGGLAVAGHLEAAAGQDAV